MKNLLYTLLISLLGTVSVLAQDPFWDDFDTFPITTYEAQNDLAFGSLDPTNYPSGRIYDRTDYNSLVLMMDGNNTTDTIIYDDWLAMYQEMLIAIQNTTSLVPDAQAPIANTWKNAKNVYEESDDAIIEGNLNIPIGIMNYDYHKIKTNALDDNLIYVDGESLKDTPGASENPFEQRRLFAAVPMLDTVESTTLHFKIDLGFYFQNVCATWTYFKIDFDDGNGLVTVNAGNTYTINYPDDGNKMLYFEMSCGGQILKNYARLHIIDPVGVTGNPTSRSNGFYDEVVDLLANNRGAKLGVRYGCGNTQIRKPIFFVSGYNPFAPFKSEIRIELPFIPIYYYYNDLNNFYKKYNDGGLLDELQSKGYDICVFRSNIGADSVANGAALLIEAIEYVNAQKAIIDSNHENIVVGYSYGALVARMALAIMEENFFEKDSSFHHSKLYVSYEGEHQGGSIPLGYLHALESITTNNASIFVPCNDLLVLADFIGTFALGGSQLFDSHIGREAILNHPIATGTPANPAAGAHPIRQVLLDKYETTNHLYTKSNGYPALMRNVGISKGASDGSMRNFDEGQALFSFDRNFNTPWFGTRQRMEVRAIGDGVRVFFRQKARRFLFSGWRNNVNESFQVPENELSIENSTGSTIGNTGILGNTLKFCSLSLSPDDLMLEDDTFVPVYSALDIRNRDPADPNYDVGMNDLLFVEPNEPNDFFGYPHLRHSSPLNITPFEAVFSLIENEDHSPGKDGDISIIKRFFITEIQPDTLSIQNRRIGQYINAYKADFEAKDYVTLGKDITFQTPIGNVTVENDGDVNLRAGRAIVFEPGVSIEIGSTLSASITHLTTCLQNITNSKNDSPNLLENSINSLYQSNLLEDLQILRRVYPNPNSGIFYIEDAANVEEIRIYDLFGRMIKRVKNVASIDMHEHKGTFILEIVEKGNYQIFQKIIIQ